MASAHASTEQPAETESTAQPPIAAEDHPVAADTDRQVRMFLHKWADAEKSANIGEVDDFYASSLNTYFSPSLKSPDHGKPGNGLLLFFRVDDFDLALQRARSLVTRLDEEPHVNPNTQTKEFSLRDPDGYYVTISAFSAA